MTNWFSACGEKEKKLTRRLYTGSSSSSHPLSLTRCCRLSLSWQFTLCVLTFRWNINKQARPSDRKKSREPGLIYSRYVYFFEPRNLSIIQSRRGESQSWAGCCFFLCNFLIMLVEEGCSLMIPKRFLFAHIHPNNNNNRLVWSASVNIVPVSFVRSN